MKLCVALAGVVALTVLGCGDNDHLGGDGSITVAPAGLQTSEGGDSSTFTIVLGVAPTDTVTLDLTTDDDGEGVVSPTTVTFSPANWNVAQTITVTGVDDDTVDGAQTFHVVTEPARSGDDWYDGYDADDVAVTNDDDDTVAFVFSQQAGLMTTESGGEAVFTIALTAAPTADVTIGFDSEDATEGAVDVTSLTFTPVNWAAPQTLTLTGVDDAVADGDQPYMVVTAATESSDPTWDGVDVPDISATNIDDETPGVTVTPVSGLSTTEDGGTDTFTIVLHSEPTAPVTIGLVSDDLGEGTVGPASVTFTAANWNAPQTVTMTGVDDAAADGDQAYTVVTGAATSADPGYAGMQIADVEVTNGDDDSPGVTVSPTSGLSTSEGGGADTFTIVLDSEPSADVTIALASDDLGEGTVSPASVTFTPLNWNAPQTVTVTGVDDALADGGQPYTIVTAAATSADAGYAGVDAADVAVINTDDDSAGITVTPTSGLSTTEGGGTDTFTIVLNSEPTADVTIPVGSSDLGEGTVSPTSVTFTPLNWNAPRTVTVTGVDDAAADGDQPYTIVTGAATSTDADYAGINPANVAVINNDDDSAGITVTPIEGLVTSEIGGTDTFTIVLDSEPTGDVTIALSSSDNEEGTVSPASVTFTSLNWNAPRTVTVTGVDDAIADGSQPFTIVTAAATSTDTTYAGLDPANVAVSNTDDDSAGITVAPTSGLVTSESGDSATFAIVLNSEPTSNVTIALSSSSDEGTVAPTSVTFTPDNWNAPRTITVTGADDAVADGDQPFTIVTGPAVSADSGYDGIDPPNVTATNTDNDSPGVTVSPTADLTTSENGGTATFTIVLNSEPTADVIVPLSSSDSTEGTVSPSTITFTTANWNAPHTVTITGVQDSAADGDQPYTIVVATMTSADGGYDGIDPPNVSVTNIDDDSPGITVTPTSGLTTSESGGSDFFTVVLNSEPSASVTITVASSSGEGTGLPAELTFTPGNWDVPQTVTVTGVDDAVADGDQPYTIVTGAAVSLDAGYDGIDPANVSVTNVDNDSAGFTIDPLDVFVSEFADTDTFTIVLNSQPLADVTIPLSSNDLTEGTVSPASVTFTSLNWNVPQTVTVTGVNDNAADGDQVYRIVTGVAVSADAGYNGLDPADVIATTFDNDIPGVFVKGKRRQLTSESGQTSFFRVRLTTQPTANVTCTFSVSDPTEGFLLPATLTFTPANYATFQNVTVGGVDDNLVDGDQLYTIISAPCTSTDAGYNGIDPRDLLGLNRDND